MEYEVTCTACGKPSTNLIDYKCPACGKPLTIKLHRKFDLTQIRNKTCSLWRYSAFFPYAKEENVVTLGEGWTPLVKFTSNVYFKLESLNPTGSFKDRGSTTQISALHKHVKDNNGYISEDSSGNAGASIAAYAARAGLKAKIYVPKTVSGPKLRQIQFYGAEVAEIEGSRTKVSEEAQKPERSKFYVGHVLHPLFRDGIRSLAYETAEQLAWQAPDQIYLPASAGTLLLGVLSGFNHLVESRILKKTPRIVACQTRQVSPLYHHFNNLHYEPPKRVTSIADALLSTNPPLLELMTKQLRNAKGETLIVEESEILDAFKELAKHGFLVEPSSAVAYAAYKKQIQNKETAKTDNTVIILTGNGLKTTLTPS